MIKYTKIKPNWFSSDSDKETYMLIIRNTTDSVDDKSDKIIDNLINTIHFNEDKIKFLFLKFRYFSGGQ